MGVFKFCIQNSRNQVCLLKGLLFHLTTFLSTGEFFLKIELLVPPQ